MNNIDFYKHCTSIAQAPYMKKSINDFMKIYIKKRYDQLKHDDQLKHEEKNIFNHSIDPLKKILVEDKQLKLNVKIDYTDIYTEIKTSCDKLKISNTNKITQITQFIISNINTYIDTYSQYFQVNKEYDKKQQILESFIQNVSSISPLFTYFSNQGEFKLSTLPNILNYNNLLFNNTDTYADEDWFILYYDNILKKLVLSLKGTDSIEAALRDVKSNLGMIILNPTVNGNIIQYISDDCKGCDKLNINNLVPIIVHSGFLTYAENIFFGNITKKGLFLQPTQFTTGITNFHHIKDILDNTNNVRNTVIQNRHDINNNTNILTPLLDIYNTILSKLPADYKTNYGLHITGHSLGGASAMLIYLLIISNSKYNLLFFKNKKLSCIFYGSPRSILSYSLDMIQPLIDHNKTIIISDKYDIVTTLPLLNENPISIGLKNTGYIFENIPEIINRSITNNLIDFISETYKNVQTISAYYWGLSKYKHQWEHLRTNNNTNIYIANNNSTSQECITFTCHRLLSYNKIVENHIIDAVYKLFPVDSIAKNAIKRTKQKYIKYKNKYITLKNILKNTILYTF